MVCASGQCGYTLKVQLAESSIQPRNGIASGRISCSLENTKVCVLSIFHLATPASPLTENICLTGLPPLPDLPSSFPLFFNLKLLHDFPFFSSIYCDRQLCRGAIWKYIFDIWSRLRLYCFPSTPIFGPTEKTEIMTILSLMGVIILILEPTMMTFSQ